MPRRIFHNFRHSHDWFRVQMLRQIGAIEGQRLLSSNAWEAVQRTGHRKIRAWIDQEMRGRSCVVVHIGSATAGRKWVEYEMRTGWADGKGVVGVHIHKLANSKKLQASNGANPLASVTVQTRGGRKNLSSVAKTCDPAGASSAEAYRSISANLEAWIEEAIAIRKATLT